MSGGEYIPKTDPRYWRQEARERRETGDKIWTSYCRYIAEGKTRDEAEKLCCERFEMYGKPITARIFNTIVTTRGSRLDPATAAKGDAIFIVTLEKLATHLNESLAACDEQLSEIEEIDRSGESWYEMEQTETTGGKLGGSVSTKKMSIAEARNMVLDRKAKIIERFHKATTDLLPKVKVNIFNDSDKDVLSQRTEQIRAEIAELEARRRVPTDVVIQ